MEAEVLRACSLLVLLRSSAVGDVSTGAVAGRRAGRARFPLVAGTAGAPCAASEQWAAQGGAALALPLVARCCPL